MYPTEDQLNNILILQKDRLIEQIDSSTLEDIEPIIQQLKLVSELWDACSYRYKLSELYIRLGERYFKLKLESCKNGSSELDSESTLFIGRLTKLSQT